MLPRASRIRRTVWRAKQRGWRELDLIIGSWAEANTHNLDDTQLAQFEELLAEEIPDLFKWLSGQEPVPEIYRENQIMQELIKHVEQGGITRV
jgi:succinate dehydrogenase flavin-adding protein (antitoxin of CptAB toxin-antitoxin module)